MDVWYRTGKLNEKVRQIMSERRLQQRGVMCEGVWIRMGFMDVMLVILVPGLTYACFPPLWCPPPEWCEWSTTMEGVEMDF